MLEYLGQLESQFDKHASAARTHARANACALLTFLHPPTHRTFYVSSVYPGSSGTRPARKSAFRARCVCELVEWYMLVHA